MSEVAWILVAAATVLAAVSVYFSRIARGERSVSAVLRNENAALADDIQRERERADLHERRASEFFGIIEGVEAEAQTWRRMFGEGMTKAGAAQNWLLRDLSEITKVANMYGARLRKHGDKAPTVQPSPGLKDLIAQFEEEAQAAVPAAPGKAEAERIEGELRGPAALNEPVETTAETG
jgi:hypothetical protein